MFALWMKAGIALILGLSVGGAVKTRKDINPSQVTCQLATSFLYSLNHAEL